MFADVVASFERLRPLAASMPEVELLLLFGSRARGTQHVRSDWDFAARSRQPAVLYRLAQALAEALGEEHVDMVDLDRAGGLVRYHAARDGQLIYEAQPGAHQRFQLAAIDFWCDAGDLIEAEYRHILTNLKP